MVKWGATMGSQDEGREMPEQNETQQGLESGRKNILAQEKDVMLSDNDPIAAALRKIHDAVLDESLPDDFLDLLDQIDQKIAAADKGA
jgi:Anti-sigma factor NepR